MVDDGGDPLAAYRATAGAFREVVTESMTKGAASTAMTAAGCRPTASASAGAAGWTHVREMLFRSAALPGGLGAVPDTKPIVLQPLSPRLEQPTAGGLGELVAAYFDLYGAGTVPEVAAFLGTAAAVVKPLLPEDVEPVLVDGHRSLATPDLLAGSPDNTDAVRLLPPADPLLGPRDRQVLADDPAARKALWPALGPPGAVLAGGEVRGFWRARLASGTLAVTVTLWTPLSPRPTGRPGRGGPADRCGAWRPAHPAGDRLAGDRAWTERSVPQRHRKPRTGAAGHCHRIGSATRRARRRCPCPRVRGPGRCRYGCP